MLFLLRNPQWQTQLNSTNAKQFKQPSKGEPVKIFHVMKEIRPKLFGSVWKQRNAGNVSFLVNIWWFWFRIMWWSFWEKCESVSMQCRQFFAPLPPLGSVLSAFQRACGWGHSCWAVWMMVMVMMMVNTMTTMVAEMMMMVCISEMIIWYQNVIYSI